MPVDDDKSANVPIAFALVFGAGASTAIGASVVFFPSLVKLASRKTLAAGLGLSAGVMCYVSFVEIMVKSILAFEDAGYDPDREAYIYGTLCFFAGAIIMLILNVVVHKLLGYQHESHDDLNDTQGLVSGSEATSMDATGMPPCCSDDPAGQLERMQHMAEEIDVDNYTPSADPAPAHSHSPPVANKEEKMAAESEDDAEGADGDLKISSAESRKLSRMSLNTAVAIALHNFPEGLATFVAALNDPGVGAVLAIAIAIHNIPEGLCVAMPVYYATGNKWRAFGWAVLSGISEPIAAFFGWLVLANSFSDTLYAVLFGMVAGMMVVISVRELLPTAHRYDPEDSVVTYSFITGMGVMAISLVLFML